MKKIVSLLLILAAAVGGWFGYQHYAAPTRVAFVNFMDYQFNSIVEANENSFIHIDRLSLKEGDFPNINGYDAVYFFAHGRVNLNEDQKATIMEGRDKGVKIFFYTPIPVTDLSNLTEEESGFVKDYMTNGGKKNIRGLLNYSRRHFDGKTLFSDPIAKPIDIPDDYYFHLGDDDQFTTLEEYETFYKASGRYTKGGPKVCLAVSILGAPDAYGFIQPLIEGFEAKGMNVYPIVGFRGRLGLAKQVDPDLVVYVPHGRFASTHGPAWLKEQNIPLLCPIAVFAPHDAWEQSQQGLDGGMLSQSIVMPELDGGSVPYTISAQFENERGLYVFDGLPERVAKFTNLVEKWAHLRTSDNADKKIAVFYYKGAGKNAMVAEGLEIAPSLLALLQRLKSEGYNTGPLPEDADALYTQIQKQGPVIGGYAKGTMETFMTDGDPELVPAGTYVDWLNEYLKPEMIVDLERDYGPAPGPYMSTVREDEPYIAIARLTFGNVTLLPVPGAGYGENEVELVHGVKKAPPHPYVAAYLWVKAGLKADAMIHFGTHGSVEFTPWKQVALSDYDWPDALTSETPHFYLYAISNIGEALIAKRRTYATMTTHITPPFMESEIYEDLIGLHEAIDKFWHAEESMLRDEYFNTAYELMRKLDINKDLEFGELTPETFDNDKKLAIHHYLHDLQQAKVMKGLHALGKDYSDEDTYETVRLMAIDSIAYSMAQLDVLNGKLDEEELESAHLFDDEYRGPALKMIDAIYHGHAQPIDYFSASEKATLAIHKPEVSGHGHTHGTGEPHAHGEHSDHSHSHGDDHGHSHGDHGHSHPHAETGPNHGMLATLRDTAGRASGQVELKLHDDKGDLELWLTNAEGQAYDLPAETTITVLFEQVSKPSTKAGTTLQLAPRNLAQNEDEDGVANMRPGQMTNYFIFPGETGADASWLNGLEFKATVLASFDSDGTAFRTDAFTLIPHTHPDGKGHDHGAHQGEIAQTDKGDSHPHARGANTHAKNPHAAGKPPHAAYSSGQSNPHAGANPYAQGKPKGGASPHGYGAYGAAPAAPVDPIEAKRTKLLETFKETLESITDFREAVQVSPQAELDAIVNGLNGGYIEPQSGGDPLVNTSAIPSGRNLYGIDAEKTPSTEAWEVGKKLVDQLLRAKKAATGEYPKKVAFSLWSSEFVRQEGITIAEIFYLLGVEPVRNRRGSVHDVALIPMEELQRPRIDVVVQTSGQFRDLGASRIYLINKAIALASAANDEGDTENYVKTGSLKAEEMMKERGLSPADARKFSTARVFGGVNGNYGTGIMGMVENGDSWEAEDEVALQYINNMGALYTEDNWGHFAPGVFEAALQNTDTVLQPRSSNTWGPLSLDHVYEFMGGLSSAARYVNGEDPDAYFSDLRNSNNPMIQSAKQAIWTETRTTLFNPKYIRALQEGGASSAETFAETFRNIFGWEVMKSNEIDEELWDGLHRVYVEDQYELGLEDYFREENPYALQEMTAIMLETVRKGYWQPTVEVQQAIAELHAQLVNDHEAGCSGFVCDNATLREFISSKLDADLAEALNQRVEQVLTAQMAEVVEGLQLSKTEPEPESQTAPQSSGSADQKQKLIWFLAILIALFAYIGISRMRSANRYR